MDAARAINEMVFAMLFVVAVGLGPFAGVLALFIHTTGVLSKLLSEAVAQQRGEAPKKAVECMVDIRVGAHIPEDYIDNLAQRIDIYKKIAGIETEDDAMDLIDELIDRFGEPPEAVIGADYRLMCDEIISAFPPPSGRYQLLALLQLDDTLSVLLDKLAD